MRTFTARGTRSVSPTIKALLLDLDDTLLVNDIEVFLPHYYRALLGKMGSLCPPTIFLDALKAGTRAMWENDGTNGTNAEAFAAEFFFRLQSSRVPCDRGQIEERFRAFYAEEFEELREYTAVDPSSRELLELAFERGCQVAIVTQPIFPREAILARLRWANVGTDAFDYDFISSYEELRACKPHAHFFQSVLQHLGRSPDECLMVGDSPADMGAAQFGLRTFWVDRGRSSSRPDSDARGSLADLIKLIRTGGIDVSQARHC